MSSTTSCVFQDLDFIGVSGLRNLIRICWNGGIRSTGLLQWMDGWTQLFDKGSMENKERGLFFVPRRSSRCWDLVAQEQSGEGVVGVTHE